ncbi:MAG: hypothetical protein IKH76_02115, partial [Clostridiales bacterium]|nr:hypothetical protein [Clostridiales bacterium]
DNPNAYGFTDAGGNIPGTLDQAAKELDENAGGTGNVAQTREGGMHEDLASYAYNESDNKPIEYVWVPAKAEVTYNYASKITLKKAVRGDRDSGYEESKYFLAMSTRTNVPPREDGTSPLDYTEFHDVVYYDYGTVGWTRWRLTVDNGSTRELDRLIIGDILAKPDDGRLSSWESVWCGMLGVKNGDDPITEGTGVNTYTMFYYVGTMEDVVDVEDETTFQIIRKGALTNALEATTYWNNTDHTIARPADPNWKTLDEITDYTTIKAFIIVFDKDVKLQPSSDIVASYQTTVANMTDGTQFNNDFAFKNDNNIFRMNYRDSDKPLTSNQVSVTLMDKPVSVEGDLWIDEDWDGVQNKGNANAEGTLDWTTNGNRRDYSKYAIIRELIEATKYTITDLREGQGTSETDLGLDQYIGYGESIEHFRFEELIPGAIAYGVVSEEELYDADGNLIKDKLRTFEPARYLLNAEIRNADLMNIFKLTDKGTNYYRSDNPDIFNLTESIDNYVLDDNFYQAGTSNNVFVTKPFFIRYSTNIDKSKDIGPP